MGAGVVGDRLEDGAFVWSSEESGTRGGVRGGGTEFVLHKKERGTEVTDVRTMTEKVGRWNRTGPVELGGVERAETADTGVTGTRGAT